MKFIPHDGPPFRPVDSSRKQADRFVLREDGTWVELRLRGSRLAEVTGGLLYAKGDLVERPRAVSWEQAREPAAGIDTALSPFALLPVYGSRRRESPSPQNRTAGVDPCRGGAAESDDAAYLRLLSFLLNDDTDRLWTQT